MPVPSNISELSQTAGSNNPPGSESPITTDDYLRTYASFIAVLRDGKGRSAEVDVASAGTCDIGAANSLFVRITGTTTITSFGTNYNGPRFVRFGGALTLTHNASTLILPGAANLTTAAGDTCIVTPLAAGWVVSSYVRASGLPVVGVTSSATESLGSTSVDFTGIPSYATLIFVDWVGLTTSGTSNPIIQLGDSGGIETASYAGAAMVATNAATPSIAANSSGFQLAVGWTAAATASGRLLLKLEDPSINLWVATLSGAYTSGGAAVLGGGGHKTLSATLDRIRFTTAGGTDTFDGGSARITWL